MIFLVPGYLFLVYSLGAFVSPLGGCPSFFSFCHFPWVASTFGVLLVTMGHLGNRRY